MYVTRGGKCYTKRYAEKLLIRVNPTDNIYMPGRINALNPRDKQIINEVLEFSNCLLIKCNVDMDSDNPPIFRDNIFVENPTYVIGKARYVQDIKKIFDAWGSLRIRDGYKSRDIRRFIDYYDESTYKNTRIIKWTVKQVVKMSNIPLIIDMIYKNVIHALNMKLVSYLLGKYPSLLYMELYSAPCNKDTDYYLVKKLIKMKKRIGKIVPYIYIKRISRCLSYDMFNIISRVFTTKNLTKLISYYVFVH